MKHLRLFESDEDEYLNEYGITPSELLLFFIDISDEGWQVRCRFKKKLKQFETTKDNLIILSTLPYIEVTIGRNTASFNRPLYIESSELYNFCKSDFYKEVIDVVKSRLQEIGLFISKEYMEGKQLSILIYREIDKMYVN